MNFINWGNETPEQLAIRKQIEEQALYEQLVRMTQAKKSQGQSPFGGAGGSNKNTPQPAQTVETELFVFNEIGSTNWQYYVLDHNNAKAIGPFVTDVSSNDYYVSDTLLVQNKGYAILFRLSEDSNDYKMIFVKVDGTPVETVSGYTSDLSTNVYGGHFIGANDYDAYTIWYFDGETLITDTTTAVGADNYFAGSQDDTANRHGIVLTKVTGTLTEYYLLTLTGAKLLTSIDTSEDPDLAARIYCYDVASTISIVKYVSSTGQMLNVEIYNAAGDLVNGYELNDDVYLSYSYNAYGRDKFIIIAPNEDGLNNVFKLVQYCESTNQFNSWTQERTVDMAYNVQYTGLYSDRFVDAAISENVAVVFYNNDGGASNGLTVVSNCTIWYVFGTGSQQSYSFTGTSLQTSLRPCSQAFFTWIDDGDGIIKILTITQGGTSVADLSLNYSDLNSIDAELAGEKLFLMLYFDEGGAKANLFNPTGSSRIELDLSEYSFISYTIEYDTVVITADSSQWYTNASLSNWSQIFLYDTRDTPNLYYTPSLSRPGQILYLNEGNIVYTHTKFTNEGEISDPGEFASDGQVVSGSNSNFGVGSSYFTNLYPGLFVLCAKNTNITSFKIDGNIGADGSGSVDTYQYSYGGYTAFVKRVYDAGDPSINQIIIIEGNGVGVSQSVDLFSDDDLHQITNIPNTSNELHYLLMAKPNGVKITDSEIDSIVENYIDLVSGKNIAAILTDLNADYSNVTGVLNPRNHPSDDRIYWFSDEGAPGKINDGGDDMYDGANILGTSYTSPRMRIITRNSIVQNIQVPNLENYYIGSDGILMTYYDPQRSGQVTILFFDLEGNEVRRVETDHVSTYQSNLVKNRGYVHCYSKEFDGENFYYRWTIYFVNLKGAGSVTFNTPDSTSKFQYILNDYAWWND